MKIFEETPTITRIEFDDGRKLTLIGSAHISRKSADEVREQIDFVLPDCICIEIDKDRWDKFHKDESDSFRDFDLVKVIKSGKFFMLMVNIILSSFQKRMGKEITGGENGMELIGAGDIANERGIPLVFADRNISTTLKRAWAKSGFFSKMNILASLFASAFDKSKLTEEELEELKDHGNLDKMLEEMAKEMPSIKEVLIDERDRYLADRIYSALGSNKLAVVGQGHTKGLIKTLSALESGNTKVDSAEYDRVPQKKGGKFKSYILPSLIVLVLLGIGVKKGWRKGLEYFVSWGVCNAGSALAGAVISFAHPLTWIVTALTSPVSALSPVLGVGIFAAVCEATVRKVRVRDLEDLTDDVSKFRKWFSNRILHAFVVLMLTSIGSTLGTFVVFPLLSKTILSLFFHA